MQQKILSFCLIIWNHKSGIHSIKIVNNETKQGGEQNRPGMEKRC